MSKTSPIFYKLEADDWAKIRCHCGNSQSDNFRHYWHRAKNFLLGMACNACNTEYLRQEFAIEPAGYVPCSKYFILFIYFSFGGGGGHKLGSLNQKNQRLCCIALWKNRLRLHKQIIGSRHKLRLKTKNIHGSNFVVFSSLFNSVKTAHLINFFSYDGSTTLEGKEELKRSAKADAKIDSSLQVKGDRTKVDVDNFESMLQYQHSKLCLQFPLCLDFKKTSVPQNTKRASASAVLLVLLLSVKNIK